MNDQVCGNNGRRSGWKIFDFDFDSDAQMLLFLLLTQNSKWEGRREAFALE
jgi:hypothetical protein